MTGINSNPVCFYDQFNLDYFNIFLYSSISNEFKQMIIILHGSYLDGLTVLAEIINIRLLKLISRQKESINKFVQLDLSQQNAEDVRKFNSKIKELCEDIEQTGPNPRDLALMVFKTYITKQVEIFIMKMIVFFHQGNQGFSLQ